MKYTVRTSIAATYKVVDGWHIFVSEELPGLCVASPDLALAYEDVAQSIQALLELDEGVRCTVVPELPLEEFIARAKGVSSEQDDFIPPVRRFSVRSLSA